LSIDVAGPIGLTLSANEDVLYLGSSVDDAEPTSTELFRFTVNRSSSAVVGITLDAVIDIQNMRYITGIMENSDDKSLRVLGFMAPTFGDFDTFGDADEIFATPALAVVPQGADTVTATAITCHDLALPLSLASTATVCSASADVEPDGDVDLNDFAGFQNCFSGDGVSFPLPACDMFDTDCDEDVDLIDLKAVGKRLGGP
jgi:hypothetical protein